MAPKTSKDQASLPPVTSEMFGSESGNWLQDSLRKAAQFVFVEPMPGSSESVWLKRESEQDLDALREERLKREYHQAAKERYRINNSPVQVKNPDGTAVFDKGGKPVFRTGSVNAKYKLDDVTGEIPELRPEESRMFLDKKRLAKESKIYNNQKGILAAVNPKTLYEVDVDGDGEMKPKQYSLEMLNASVPAKHFKTKVQAQQSVQRYIDRLARNEYANSRGLTITPPEGGKWPPGGHAKAILDAQRLREIENLKIKATAASERKWGKTGDADNQSKGVSGVSGTGSPIGEGATPEAEMEWGQYQAGQELTTAQINSLREATVTANNRLAFERNDKKRERNHEIKMEQARQEALALQREADNAQAILIHDKQHLSNMEFFDKKKEAYEQERFMDYIQGGVNGLGSLFQLFML